MLLAGVLRRMCCYALCMSCMAVLNNCRLALRQQSHARSKNSNPVKDIMFFHFNSTPRSSAVGMEEGNIVDQIDVRGTHIRPLLSDHTIIFLPRHP